MRKLVATLLCVFVSLFAKTQIINIDDASTYLPAEVVAIKLGIGIADFQVALDTAKMERIASMENGFTQFKLNKPSQSLNTISFKFDRPLNGVNINRPLYEISLEFATAEVADEFVSSNFKSMYRITEKADKEWFLSTNKDYWMIVRKTANTVILAAMISGTEWGFE